MRVCVRTFYSYLCVALLSPCVAKASAPEGMENFGILNRGSVSPSLNALGSYTSPAWQSDYTSFESIASIPLGSNLLTFGGKTSVGSAYANRSAYFLRYDWIYADTFSVSLKWAHEDWKYISTSKDAFGLELNQFFAIADKSGLYFSLGGYYRYLKQRWNPPWWSPVNFKTKDREGYFTGVVGWKHAVTEKSFYTFDINIRDAWSYYPLDHMAFDLNIYLNGGETFYWKLNGGIRASAILVGTAYPAIYYGGIGFVVH